jgi:hypothetical protein
VAYHHSTRMFAAAVFTLVENERDPAAQEQINAYKAKYADEIAQNNAHKVGIWQASRCP